MNFEQAMIDSVVNKIKVKLQCDYTMEDAIAETKRESMASDIIFEKAIAIIEGKG